MDGRYNWRTNHVMSPSHGVTLLVRHSSFISAIVTELLHYSQESLWAIALLPTAFGKSTAVFASGIQISRRDSDPA